ncbi:hypothetical protein [Altererythrobacter sp. ZODW24]|uniref:hypothetical protein n=1 Tax=Altererythrobacter sp. ZODW24 TaxID=2185142 RepID=UPI000DF728F4|nr:hypothetical protein [Altererythrobacter sp. ZODW24]
MKRFRSLIFALVALVVSALNPPGYMASASAEGISISICSGRGADSAVITRDDPRYEAYAAIYGESDDSSHGSENEVRDGCSIAGFDTHALKPDNAADVASTSCAFAITSGLPALSVRTPRASPLSTGPPVRA